MNKKSQNNIEVWERKILRRMYGGKKADVQGANNKRSVGDKKIPLVGLHCGWMMDDVLKNCVNK